MATWFPIVPDSTSRAASLPVRSAMKDSKLLVCGVGLEDVVEEGCGGDCG